MALFGREHFVGNGIVHNCGDDLTFAFERDRNGKLRNAVQEIRRAVERIDDESVRLVLTVYHAGFFDEETVARTRF